MTECLMGNLWPDFEPLFQAVAEFADVPAPVAHGQPQEKAAEEPAPTNASMTAE